MSSSSDKTVWPQPPGVDELRSKLSSFCEKHRVEKLEVFGSVAKGTAKPGSDVDLIVTFKFGSAEPLRDFVGLRLELEDLLGCSVDLLSRESVDGIEDWNRRKSILSCTRVIYAN